MGDEGERSMLEGETRVLVPLELPGEFELSDSLIEILKEARVVVLGCHVVPDQTSPEHARSQFEEAGQSSIDRVVGALQDAGIDAQTELVFTPDPIHTIDRVSDNLRIDALMWPQPVESIDEILAVVSPGVEYDRVVKCLATTAAVGDPSVDLVEFVANEADEAERDLALDGLVARLKGAGLKGERLDTLSRASNSPLDDLEEMVGSYDLVVLAYTAEMANRRFVDEVRHRVDVPVLIVRAEA